MRRKSTRRRKFKGGEREPYPGFKNKRIHDFYGKEHLSYLTKLIVAQLKDTNSFVYKFYMNINDSARRDFVAELDAFTISYSIVNNYYSNNKPKNNDDAIFSNINEHKEEINKVINSYFETDMNTADPKEYGPKLIELLQGLYTRYA